MGYESRPLIRITPAQDASDRRVKVFNYVEAIRSLPTNFYSDELKLIMSKVNPRLYCDLRETFMVIDDDMDRVNKSRRSRDSELVTDGSVATGANSTSLGSKSRGSKRSNPSPSSQSSKSAKV